MPRVRKRTGRTPQTEPFSEAPLPTDPGPPIPEREPVEIEGSTTTVMEPSNRPGGRDETFGAEVAHEDLPGGFTPAEPRTMRRDVPAAPTPEPGPLDLLEELRKGFESIKLPEIIAPAEGAELPTSLHADVDGLESDDRDAIAQRRLDRLRAELQDELAGTDAEHWKLFAFGDLARSVGGGLRDAGQEVIDSLRALSDFLRVPENIEVLGRELPRITGDLPEVAPPETLAGGVARPLTSFLAGFLPMVRAARGVGIGHRLAQDVVAAAAAGALTMPTDQPSIADSLAEIPGLGEAVPEFLLSEPGDTEAEAKFKRAFGEALGVGVGEMIFRPVINGMKFLRARQAIRSAADLPPSTPARAIPKDQVDRLRRLFEGRRQRVPEADIRTDAEAAHGFAQRIVSDGLTEENRTRMLGHLTDLVSKRALNEGVKFGDVFGQIRVNDATLVRMAKRTARMSPEQLALADPRVTFRMLGESGARGRTVMSYWTNSILLNVPGRAIDFTTNLANTFVVPGEKTVATALTRGPRAATRELRATAYGTLQSLGEAFRLAGRAFNEGRSVVDPGQFTRAEIASLVVQPRTFGEVVRQGNLAIVGDVLTKGAFRTIAAGDDLFKTLLARGELGRLAAREVMDQGLTGEAAARELARLTTHPTDDMLRSALDTARYGTFTRPLGELGEAAIRFRDQFPLGRFVVPFGRSPTNIVKFAALDRTPLGLISRSIRRDLSGANGREAAALAATRMAWGSALLGLAAKWAAEGYIVGGGPADPEQRRLALGDRPAYTLRVGDRHAQFNQFAPLGSLLAYGADLASIAGLVSQDEFDQLHAAIIAASYRNLLDVPLFDGAATVAFVVEDLAHNRPDAAMRLLNQVAGGFVPGPAAAVERALDPNIREARTLLDTVIARIPGMSEELPARLDPLGEPFAPKVGFSDSAAERFFSPLMAYRDNARLREVREFMVERGLEVSYPRRSIRGVPIDSATHQRLIKRRAELALPELRHMIQQAEFKEAPQPLQQDRISTLFEKAGQAASAEIIEGNPLLRLRIEQVERFEITPQEGSMRRGFLSLESAR